MKSFGLCVLLSALAPVAMAENLMVTCYAGIKDGCPVATDRRVLREKEGRRLNSVCGKFCADFDPDMVCMEFMCGANTAGMTCDGTPGDEFDWGAVPGLRQKAEAWFFKQHEADDCVDLESVQCTCGDETTAANLDNTDTDVSDVPPTPAPTP